MTNSDLLAQEIEEFELSIRRRNLREAIAAVVVGLAWGLPALATDVQIERVSAVFVVAVGLIVAGFGLVFGGTRGRPEDAPNLEAHRNELRHQARLLRWAPLWYVAPIAAALIFAAAVRPSPVFGIAFVMAISAAVIVLNLHTAANLEQRAERLSGAG